MIPVGLIALMYSILEYYAKGGNGQCCPALISCYPCQNQVPAIDYVLFVLGIALVLSGPALIIVVFRRTRERPGELSLK